MPYYPADHNTGAFQLRLELTPVYFREPPAHTTTPLMVDALAFATPQWVVVYTTSASVYFTTNIPRAEGRSVLETLRSSMAVSHHLLPDRDGMYQLTNGTCTKITTARAQEIARDWDASGGLYGPLTAFGSHSPPHDREFRKEFLRSLVLNRAGWFGDEGGLPCPPFLLVTPPAPGTWRHSPAMRTLCAKLAQAVAEAVKRLRAPLGDVTPWRAMAQVQWHLRRAANILDAVSVTPSSLDALSDYVTREAQASLWSPLSQDERVLVSCGCGHVELFGEDVVTDVRGHAYCGSCAEDCLREPLDEPGGYDHIDNLYWHEDAAGYLTYPPQDNDDDEDDSDSSSLLWGWGASCSRLNHDTTFVPSPHGEFTMGVELEVYAPDACQGRSKALCHCDEHFNQDASLYAMFKRDGSLDDSQGFEIVTAARRMGDHIEKFEGWTPMQGMRAWDTGSCGMHVHIDSRAFSALSIGKFLMFLNSDATTALVRGIAGRHPRQDAQARSYAACLDQQVLGNPKQAATASEATGTRYRLVNLANLTKSEADRLKVKYSRDCKGDYSTVEVRVFRATLNKKRLLAQIEFTHAAVMFCREASWGALGEGDFRAWLASQPAYKHLRRWLGLLKAPRHTPAEAEAEA